VGEVLADDFLGPVTLDALRPRVDQRAREPDEARQANRSTIDERHAPAATELHGLRGLQRIARDDEIAELRTARFGEALIIVPPDLVGQVLELVEMAGAAVRLPAHFLQAIDVEIYGRERMADAVGIAFLSSSLAAVYRWRSPVVQIHSDDYGNVPFAVPMRIVGARLEQHVTF